MDRLRTTNLLFVVRDSQTATACLDALVVHLPKPLRGRACATLPTRGVEI
jgi:hypothetical protein